MKNHDLTNSKRDINICKAKIIAVLEEYNCSIYDKEGYYGCYIIDNDTKETESFP